MTAVATPPGSATPPASTADAPSPARGPRAAAALTGVLAGAAGLVVGELAGRLLPGGASPVLSVADRIIDLTPDGLRRTLISAFGTADKPLLLAGVLVVCALLAAAGGVLALRRPFAAVALLGGLGLLALLAQLPEPGTTAFGAGFTALLLVVAAGSVLGRLSPLAAQSVDGPSRRRLLRGAAGATALVGLGGWALRRMLTGERVDAIRAAVGLPAPVRSAPGDLAAADLGIEGVSSPLTPNAAFYRIDTALAIPQIDPATWSMQIDGMVRTPYSLTYADLLAMPQVEADVTLQCVSNEVGGDLVGTARWQGVLLRDVLQRAGVDPAAEQILSTSVDGFTAGFPVPYAFNGSPAMIAVAMNGTPLPLVNGFPARLVVPGLYGYISATKWLARITLTRRDVDGYWIPRGWSKDAPIKTSSRIEVPRDSTLLRAGRTAVAGTAWAPGRGRGVTAVEVRVDGGPWQQARLGGALSEDTWRQWSWTWDAEPGDHLIEARATDRKGDVQTGEIAPPDPDGATGYHQVLVRVDA